MAEHECEYLFDESDLGREVECRYGCGRRVKVVMDEDGGLGLRRVD